MEAIARASCPPVVAELAASVVLAELVALAELAVSAERAEWVVPAELEARVTNGSTTRNIEAARHIRIERPRTALVVRLAEIRWPIARREQGNRLASKAEIWRVIAAEVREQATVRRPAALEIVPAVPALEPEPAIVPEEPEPAIARREPAIAPLAVARIP